MPKILELTKVQHTEPSFLKSRFGDHYAQLSVDTTSKLKLAVRDVSRLKYGKVPYDVEELCKKFIMPPQSVSDYDFIMGYESDEGHHVLGSIEYDPALMAYVERHEDDWEIVKKCLGLPRQKGRHACAFCIANRPIHEFIPLTEISGVKVTQYTAKSVEAAGGLKYDFLVVNSLNDIGNCIDLIQKRNGGLIQEGVYINNKYVEPHYVVVQNGVMHDIWDLPEDQAVFKDIAAGRTETVFQYNTHAAQSYLTGHFNHTKPDGNKTIDSILAMSAFTALDRPGPLDVLVSKPDAGENDKKHNMLVEYARRARGEAPSKDVLEIFNTLLPETYGVMVYQEQLQKCYQYLTGCTATEAEDFRYNVGKKAVKKVQAAYPFFLKHASAKIGEADAKSVWQFFITWAKYGFNKSHAVCYAHMGYACAYLKHYFPLEWWTSVLKNADKNEINDKFWRYCGKYIDLPDVKLSGHDFEIQNDRIRAPASLLHGVGETAHAQLCKYMPYTSIEDFCNKIQQHKEAGSKMVYTTKINKKTGKVTQAETKRMGHSALNRGVVYALIISGAMDSLFPKTIGEGEFERETTALDYLTIYETELARATGAKQQPVNAKFSKVGPLTRYQMRKAVLPAYSEDLLPYMKQMEPQNFKNPEKPTSAALYSWGNAWIPVVSKNIIDKINNAPMIRPGGVTVAIPVYIESQKTWSFVRDGKTQTACKFMVDVNGAKHELVRWGDKKGFLDELYKEELTGCVAMFVCTKTKAGKGFSIDDLIVIHQKLKDTKEENE